MTFKDKAKWFSFEISFFLAPSYAYACAYVDAYGSIIILRALRL